GQGRFETSGVGVINDGGNATGARRESASFQAGAHMFKAEDRLALFDLHASIRWAGVFDVLAVGNVPRRQSQARADRFFLSGMNVLFLTHVGDDGDADVG